MEVGFGLGAAVMNAVVAILSTRLARQYPARQLLAPLFALNCLLVLPFAPFVAWTWSPAVVLLLAASTAALVISSVAIWDMYDHGGAAPTVTAQSVSPLPAAIATGLLLPGELSAAQVVAALVVVVGVLIALRDQFGALGRRRTATWILVAAVGTGLVTVLGRLLADAGSGVVETYVVRTGASAAVCVVLWPPRKVPLRDLPRMIPRAMAITAHLGLILMGVQGGNPAVIQTVVATGPLFAIGWEMISHNRTPSAALVLGALIAVVGVALVLLA